MLKRIRAGESRLEDGSKVHVQHFLDETPPKFFPLNTNLPIPESQRYTRDDADRVFRALIPARYLAPAEASHEEASGVR